MESKGFLDSIKSTCNVLAVKGKANAPEILIGAGVIGCVGAAVWACNRTLKLPEATNKAQKNVDLIKGVYGDVVEDKSAPEHKEYVKEITKTYTFETWDIVKLYSGPVILGTVSIAAIFASNKMLRNTCTQLAAVATATEVAYKNYRKAVIEKYGEEADKELRFPTKKETITVTETTKSGKEKEVEKEVDVIDKDKLALYSPYAKFFDESSREWRKSSDYNLDFLLARQAEANIRLKAQGYLFLKDVYEMLDIKITPASCVVGWIYDKDNPVGDNYVDFGLYDGDKEGSRRFVNELDNAVLLDFNVDGVIQDRI